MRADGVLRVDAETAIILREAFHKIETLYRATHYGLYDYVRSVAGKIAPNDPVRDPLGTLIKEAEQTQSELIEMMLDADDGPEQRFALLTPTQQSVALLLVEDAGNTRIATELGITVNTVKSHLRTILSKYGMANRNQVAADVSRYLAR